MMAAPTTTVFSAAVLLCCAAAAFLAADATGGRHLMEATPAADARLVAVACANVTGRGRHYGGPGLTRDFCEITLWSDKRAASAAHPRDLALVAIDLVREGAAGAAAKVGGALGSGSDDGAAAKKKLSRDAALNLRYCQLDYEAVARTVPVCREMVQEYEPAGVDGEGPPMIPYNYLECAGKVVSAALDCWAHILNGDETKKAVWKEVSEAATRANLAKAMVQQMLGVVGDFGKDAADDDDDEYDHYHVVDDDDDDNHHNADGSRHVIDDDDDDDDNHHHVVDGNHHVIDDDDNHHHVVDDDDDD